MRSTTLALSIPPRLRSLLKQIVPTRARHWLHENEYYVRLYQNAYSHHRSLSGGTSMLGRLRSAAQTAKKFAGGKRILCYPHLPGPGHVFYKIALQNGFSLVNDLATSHDLVVKWEDATYASTSPAINRLRASSKIVNGEVTNISKSRVGEVFEKAFGYKLQVDPTRYEGACVKKSEENAAHDGEIVSCPVEEPERGFVYQKLIRCELKEGLTEDVRVPVLGAHIPFVYVKHKPADRRFAYGSHTTGWVAETADVFAREEIEKILRFAAEMGLDYGEMDVLRDKEDGRIYIVDANNTPSGPSSILSGEDYRNALQRLATAFEEEFLEPILS